MKMDSINILFVQFNVEFQVQMIAYHQCKITGKHKI